MTAVANRRQSAREAYHDKMAEILPTTVTGFPAVEEAIEVATRVQIDNEIMAAAAGSGLVPAGMPREQQRRCLAVIFRAAGFEVVE